MPLNSVFRLPARLRDAVLRGLAGKRLFRDEERLPYRFVLGFGLLFGLGVLCLSPPFSVPDELAHFQRAYHCSLGRLYAAKRGETAGDPLPASLSESYHVIAAGAGCDEEFQVSRVRLQTAWSKPLDPRREEFAGFPNTALYTPVPYLPQTAAIGLGRLWELGPLPLLYLGRLANLLAYAVLAAWAVRVAPVHKWPLAMVALMPMSIYLGASLSADAMTIGLALLLIATALNIAIVPSSPFSRGGFVEAATGDRRLLALGALLVLVALCKQAYLGLVLLAFLVPSDRFRSAGRRWLTVGLLVAVPVGLCTMWTASVRGIYVPMLPFVDPAAQARWIVAHPWSYAAVVGKALYHESDYSFLIGVFGWLGAHLPKWIRDVYWAALGVVAFLDGGKPLPLGAGIRAIAFGVYVVTGAIMATFVYLSWEFVGCKSIGGMQPRYFLPILPLVLLPLRGPAVLAAGKSSRNLVPVVAMSTIVLAAGVTCWTLVKRYYWP